MSSVDKLIIETPEQTSLEFPLAGIGSRFLALALDTLLQGTAFTILAIIIGLLAYWGRELVANLGNWSFAIIIFVYFLLHFGYFALFEAIWNGQTPGKRWTHLRVIKDSGRPIGTNEAILRNLLRIIDALPTLYATGIVCVLISRENKRVGDYAAGTVVVHEKPIQGGLPVWASAIPAQQPLMPGTVHSPFHLTVHLTVEELQVIESFLDRRNGLAPDVRWSFARQLADRFGKQLNIPPESRQDTEQFLQTIAEQGRSASRFH